MATRIIVIFNLKQGVNAQDYENWARTVDAPAVQGLGSVDGFDVLRSTGVLGSDAAPPYQYVEVLDVGDMDALGGDISTPKMQEISGQFQEWADNPIFILTERI